MTGQEGIGWRTDYDDAMREGGRLDRRVVVHFWMQGRPLCRTMEMETFAHPEVIRLSREKFLNVKVDIDARPELFESLIGGRGGLATCVVDVEGDVVSALPGFAGPEAYLEFLKRADGGYPKLVEARKKNGGLADLYALGEVYEVLGSPRRAEQIFVEVVGKSAEGEARRYVAYGHERIARYRALRGRNLEVRRHLAEYRKLDPGNTFGRGDRIVLSEALACSIEREFAEALRLLAEGMRAYPSSGEAPQMLFLTGVILHESGNNARAIETLEQVQKDHPQSSWSASAKERIVHILDPNSGHKH